MKGTAPMNKFLTKKFAFHSTKSQTSFHLEHKSSIRSFTSRSDKKIALLGIPYDLASSYMRGASVAPPAIRLAYENPSSNTASEKGIDLYSLKSPLSPFIDTGDIEFKEEKYPTFLDLAKKIEEDIDGLLKRNLPVISFGGDHSISYPLVKSFGKKYTNLAILHFDAHPDIYDNYEGDKYSHACPFARIMEEGVVKDLRQVGIRTAVQHQREQQEKFKVKVIEMKDWTDQMIESTFFKFDKDVPVYISFDMDVLDPAFAPGVSHHEPGGMSTRQCLNIIHILQKNRVRVVGADIVELNPMRDPTGVTAMVAARILKEIAAHILLQ